MLYDKIKRIGSLQSVDQLVRLVSRLDGIVVSVTDTAIDYIEDGNAYSLNYNYVDGRIQVK